MNKKIFFSIIACCTFMHQTKAQFNNNRMETATLAGGCFWCTEAIYKELNGVSEVTSGYTGGTTQNPTYQEVSSGTTGHAEAINIQFDPSVISFTEILQVFFETHDPTTLNRQGADIGTQYRSAIFYHNEEQKETAESIIKELNAEVYDGKIVTEVTPFDVFYTAEDYHQDYFEKNPSQGYCQIVIVPKLEKFRKIFADKLKQ